MRAPTRLPRRAVQESGVAESGVFTFKINPAQAEKLRAILGEKGFTFREVPYTLFGAQKQKLTINAYTSGKLLVQGRGAKEFVEFVIEPEITGEAKVGYDEVHNPEMFQPHLGIDESGKGDFFGPLVIAGVFTDGDLARQLRDLGVRDSKQIGSDHKALDLAEEIRELIGRARWDVITILPNRYNELHAKFRNLNRLLAWGHASVIENLLTRWPDCPRALSDKFAHESLIQRALKERGKKIVLQQRTKAESDIAVAAASILARAEFLTRLEKLGETVGAVLPKGASAQVRARAGEILKSKGEARLRSVAKTHFKTFQEVLNGDLLSDLEPEE
jgi:ribonuclease HIII